MTKSSDNYTIKQDNRPTKLTWVISNLGPTEMWVEGNKARSYESQGFEIVDYKPPPEWLRGCYSGKALIRKTGSECTHVWSLELSALHKHICATFSKHMLDVSLRSPSRKKLNAAHSKLFGELKYHEELIFVEKFDTKTPLEVPQQRIVTALQKLAKEETGKTAKILYNIAKDIANWKYSPKKKMRQK